MKIKVLNTTPVLKVVQIIDANNKQDSINIQPFGRATLPEGATVPESYTRAHPEIKLVDFD